MGPSIQRTIVPLLVGYVVAGLTAIGLSVPDDVREWLTGAIGLVVATAYYALVRVLERKWPALSVLLGSGQQPAAYSPDGQTAPAAPAVTVTTATTAADPTPPAS